MLERKIFYKTIGIVLFLWAVFLFGEIGLYSKNLYTTFYKNGFHTIFTGVFMHANLNHIIGNTRALLLTIPIILYLYKKDFLRITLSGLFLPSLAVYIIGSNVIGISGLTFTYIWFIIFCGIGSKDKLRFLTSMFFIFFYGSSLVGVTPLVGFGISWRIHLFGMIVAFFYSIGRYLRK